MRTNFWRRLLAIAFTFPLVAGLALATTPNPATAWVGQATWFDENIIDTDHDAKFDLSVCYGDNTSQGVYTGRVALQERLEINIGYYVSVGDNDVAGRAYDDGFVSSGVCDDDGSSVHIHYENADSGVARSEPAQNLRECHIYLNSDYTFSWKLPTEWNKVDGPAVITHELLHCWGLNHSNPNFTDGVHNALMHQGHTGHNRMNYLCEFYGDTQWITADDIAGAEEVYDGGWWFFNSVKFLSDQNHGAPPNPCTD